ncbi:DUF4373 domain-containing protein [Lactobacillus sp. S2-2]|uniref:DUF4373 domain-containing protein n=1 Tax=Lactobacillus sp. S2-2 TaxID=2692917 RepID=UPI001F332C8C|nr:DUF4373 domain-containing protein [Lactobacillus sp. S2-2]MCF6515513.1 DUF4373 domain-containing protein [Lactobacillus sp. S2-2]
MARPIKLGLDYFPLDVDFSTNEKTEAIMGEFGAKGVLFMAYLLSAVYKNGYFLKWDKLKQMQLANRIDGLNPELTNQIVNRLIAYGTFNEELFNSAKVLTSQRIQDTFLDATKRRKSEIPTEYWLDNQSNVVNVDNNSIKKEKSEVNVDINTQSKVNKSKVNKIKDNKQVQEDFEKLWQLYPKKQGKTIALRAYTKAINDGVTNKEIQNGIQNYIKHLKIKNTESQYIKQGSTYFNQRSWEDELDMQPNGNVRESVPEWINNDNYGSPKQPKKEVDMSKLEEQLARRRANADD